MTAEEERIVSKDSIGRVVLIIIIIVGVAFFLLFLGMRGAKAEPGSVITLPGFPARVFGLNRAALGNRFEIVITRAGLEVHPKEVKGRDFLLERTWLGDHFEVMLTGDYIIIHPVKEEKQ